MELDEAQRLLRWIGEDRADMGAGPEAIRIVLEHAEDMERGLASARERADNAEAAIHRVKALCRRQLEVPLGVHAVLIADVLAALDEPESS